MSHPIHAKDVHCPACPRGGPCVAAKARNVGNWLHVEGYPGGCPYLSGALAPGEPLPQDRKALAPPAEIPPHRVDGFAAAMAREERRGYR
jgi:hypothetical protein